MGHLDLSCLQSTVCFVTGQAPKLSFWMSSVLVLLLGDPCDDEDIPGSIDCEFQRTLLGAAAAVVVLVDMAHSVRAGMALVV